MRRDKEKRNPYQQIQDFLSDHFPEIAKGAFPDERLNNALKALAGNIVPLPREVVDMLFPKLHGGIYEVALASNGTIAVIGKYNSSDPDRVVLVADPYMMVPGPGNERFEEAFSDRRISGLFFPEGSSHPAFMAHGQNSARAEFHDEWVWDLGDEQIRLPAPQNDPTAHPLFWTDKDGLPQGAITAHEKLYESNGLYPHEVRPVDLDLSEDLRPTYISLVADHLLSKWNCPTLTSDLRRHRRCHLVWNGQITPELRVYPKSITEGPDGQPHFLIKQQEGPVCLANMHGYVNALDHEPEMVWTAPGKIFTLQNVPTGDPDRGPISMIHEVISDWRSTSIEGQGVIRVWPIEDEPGETVVVILTNEGCLRYHGARDVLGGFVSLGQTKVTKIGSVFGYEFENKFGFAEEGQYSFAVDGVPRHELTLNDLVLMDDGSIQGVAKIGSAVITYKFYDPSV